MQNKKSVTPKNMKTREIIMFVILFIFMFFTLQLSLDLGGAIGGVISGLVAGSIMFLLNKLWLGGNDR